MRVLFLGIFAALFFASCETLDRFTQFDIPYSTTFSIPATPVAGVSLPVLNIASPAITTNIKEKLQRFSTSTDLIDKVTLKSLELSIVDPANEDFSFLKRVTLYIDANGLDEKEIATKDNIATNPTGTLTFDVTGVNLKDYIIADEFTLRLSVEIDETTTVKYEIKTDMVFNIDAKLLGS